jgi:hypothetical protein
MKTKILPNIFNIFISVGLLFASARLLVGGLRDGVLDVGNTPFGLPIITFDAPGAGTGPNQGTFAYAINLGSTIMGFYLDASNVYHGFVRATDGTITTFSTWCGTGLSRAPTL